jgi:hypothetical protein
VSRTSAKRRERERLFAQLKLQADVLCESNRKEVLPRMLSTLLRVMPTKIDDEKRGELLDIFRACDSNDDLSVEVSANDRILYVQGNIDLVKLSKLVVWSKHGGMVLEN